MSSTARRIAALERRQGGDDPAMLRRECRRLAAELGFDPAALWAEAERIAEIAARPTPEAYAAAVAAAYDLDPADVARALAEGAP